MERVERMLELYHWLYLGGRALSCVSFAGVAVLFVRLQIPAMVGRLTGWAERRSVKRMRENMRDGGKG